ncbi:putative uncharacterized protein DDB_G0282133 [Carica papaya]|uniref:putative uncharacterized protein DDB_G0282133 n=1 Tax=Carica papaya TaxID=3649 RepID=UPI000B8CDE3F|nr:putative uncharacterized protein DDB_G0282133 [Carica papaya]
MNQPQQVVGTNIYGLNYANMNQREMIEPNGYELSQFCGNQQEQGIRSNIYGLNQVHMNQQPQMIGPTVYEFHQVNLNQQQQVIGSLNQVNMNQQQNIRPSIDELKQIDQTRINQQQKEEMIAPNYLENLIGLQLNIGEMPKNMSLNLDQTVLDNTTNLTMTSNQLSKPENMVNLMMVNNKYEYSSNRNNNMSFNNSQPGISSRDACGSTNMSFNNQLGMTFSDSYDSRNIGNHLMGFNNQYGVNFLDDPCGSNMKNLGMNNKSIMNFNEMRNLSIGYQSMGSLVDEFGSSINVVDSGLDHQFGFEDMVGMSLINDYKALNQDSNINFCGKDGLSSIGSGSLNMSEKQNNIMAANKSVGSGSNNMAAERSFNDKSKSNTMKNVTLSNEDEFNNVRNKLFNNQNGLDMENTSYSGEYGLESMSFEDKEHEFRHTTSIWIRRVRKYNNGK